MKIVSDASTGHTSTDIRDLFVAQQGSKPSFLAVYASASCDLDCIQTEAALAEAQAFHGATTCLGVMTNKGVFGRDGDGFGYLAIWDTSGAYGTASRPFTGDPQAAARMALEQALNRADRVGEVPALVWVSATPGSEEAVISGIEEIVGPDVPIFGGSAADNTVTGGWSIFGEDGQFAEGLTVSVLYPSGEIASSFQSGYAPTGKTALVTKAEGRRIETLDDKPAVEVYENLSGLTLPTCSDAAPTSILSQSSFNPLGRELTEIAKVPFHLLMHPAMRHQDGAISLFADVAEGNVIHFMEGSPDSLTQRAGRTAKQTVQASRANPAGALVIYCAGCMLSVLDRMDEVAAEIDVALDHKPFLGVFTFGEQGHTANGQNCHGNLMISCVTLSS